MAETVFQFGKHRGKTFAQVLQHERGYVEWSQKTENPSGMLKAFVDFVRSQGDRPVQNTTPQEVPTVDSGGAVRGKQHAVLLDVRSQQSTNGVHTGSLSPSQQDAFFHQFGFCDARATDSVAVPLPRPPTTIQAALTGNARPDGSSFVPGLPGSTVNLPVPTTTVPEARGCNLVVELCGSSEFRIIPVQGHIPNAVWQSLTRDLPGSVLGASRREWRFPLDNHNAVIAAFKSHAVLQACSVEMLPDWIIHNISATKHAAARRAREAEELLNTYLASLPEEIQQERPVMQFQKDGIRFGLARGGRVLLGDEMGLGKTLQALAIAGQYQSEWPAIVVAPSALRFVWRDQALSWLPWLCPADVQVLSQAKQPIDHAARLLVISYDQLARTERFQVRADGAPYNVVILDEAHYIKDPKSKRSIVSLKVCRKASRCILISGTPAVNKASELHTQLQALLQHGAPTYNRFCERYCDKKEVRFHNSKIVKWAGAKRPAELNAVLTETVMIRRLKRDVLQQLPRKRRQRITLDSSKLDKAKMSEVARLMSENETVEVETDDDHRIQGQIMQIYRATAEAKIEGVNDYVEYLVSNDLKFLVFAHHHSVLDGIQQKLDALDVKHIRIDGSTIAKKRQENVNQFQTDEKTRVAVLSITACGQGLTLTAAHTVVFAELYWVPGQMMQAEDRVHRIGQEHSVDIHYCIAENTIDETLFGSLNKKARDTSAVLDGGEGRSLGARSETWRQLSTDIATACVPLQPDGTVPEAHPGAVGSPGGAAIDVEAPCSEAVASSAKRRCEDAPTGIAKFFKPAQAPVPL